MKLLPAAAIISVTALLAPQVQANAALAKKSNCLACHMVDRKLVGPSYQDVAKRYAGDKNAEAKLFEKVKKGGSGAWKDQGITIPMPPNSTVRDEDVRTLVKWILGGAK
ncbi:MAG: c-type cytochrome [Rhodocyclales bacterium]|nr:c-type cytochrome [Rhodocyclales bacterium]